MTDLIFLGTSSGVPTRTRNQSSLVIRFGDGAAWMVDCGEATQHRLQRSAVRPSAIEAILITHLHGDHCFGLPGMLAALDIAEPHERPLTMVGPRGLKGMLMPMLRASGTRPKFPLHWQELDGDADLTLGGRRLAARQVRHRLPCFAYSIREPDLPGALAVDALCALGLPPGPLYGEIQAGRDVTLPDGRVLAAAAFRGPDRPGHHLVVVGDTSDAGNAAAAATGCDVLVHEATFMEERREKARRWQHATTAMAVAFARQVAARHLVLTHFSSRYTGAAAVPGMADLLVEAQAAAGELPVFAAADLDVYQLDYKGGRRLRMVGDEDDGPPP
jgi:ribonuclease Z